MVIMRPHMLILVTVLVVLSLLVLVLGERPARHGSRYGFYRSMMVNGSGSDDVLYTRRVFGGEIAQLTDFPTVCALLDHYWSSRCTAAVVAPRWALTAAHCITPLLAYVKYNTRRLTPQDGDITSVLYLYKHPEYTVGQEGDDPDVTLLHHDVGLVETLDDMNIVLRTNPINILRKYNPIDLKDKEIQVLGFGLTESSQGEKLLSAKLRLVYCDRATWFHCVCGVSAGRSGRGVCSGDSGGPLVYNGVQVGVTSMGPLDCALMTRNPTSDALSVFTALYNYMDLLNNTIYGTDAALRMNMINGNELRDREMIRGDSVPLKNDIDVMAPAMTIVCSYGLYFCSDFITNYIFF